jgi:hypothetical protein
LDTRSWLAGFKDTKLVDLLVIPGTHNSGSSKSGAHESWWKKTCFCYVRQQSLSIYDQLCAGIRFLDFRLHVEDEGEFPNVFLSHSFDTHYTLADALNEVAFFLAEYPTEFVIVYIRIDHWWRSKAKKGQWQAIVEKTLRSSRLELASIEAEALDHAKVSDLAGKALILMPDNNTVVSRESGISFLDSLKHYKVFDVWRFSGVADAMLAVSDHMYARHTEQRPRNVLGGLALDLTVIGLPPSWTSAELNEWFLARAESDPEWTGQPMGVLLLDFADEMLLRRLFTAFGIF